MLIVLLSTASYIGAFKILQEEWTMKTDWYVAFGMLITGLFLTGIYIEKNRGILASALIANGAFSALGLYLLSYSDTYQKMMLGIGYLFTILTGITVFYIKQNQTNRKRIIKKEKQEEKGFFDFFISINEFFANFFKYRKEYGNIIAFKIAVVGIEEEENALDFIVGKEVEMEDEYQNL